MNKSYTFLIAILIIIAIAIGSFALYRSSTVNKSSAPLNQNFSAPSPSVVKSPPPQTTGEDQISKNNTLPLTIISPQNGAEVSVSSLIVSGTTSAKADVSINDKELKADANGQFNSLLNLEEGDNYILVVVSDENGASEWQGTVTYNPSN